MSLFYQLAEARRYRDQIDRLHLKYSRRGLLYQLTQDGVPLASFVFDRNRLARLLAREVSAGRYAPEPAQTRLIKVNGKSRLLYNFRLTDRIVHGALSSLICERMEGRASPHLYSYRKGMNWLSGIADFARYVRDHRHSIPDVRHRGLYVVRRDVRKYTDSIPVDESSPVWPMLWDILDLRAERRQRRLPYQELVREIVRPHIVSEAGLLYQNIAGVPTGSAISTALFNLYLLRLDDEIERLPGGFYARYSDDILFAHPDPSVANLAAERIAAGLAARGLGTNEEKDENLYFNGAGRPSPFSQCSRGTTHISFLGCNIRFDGTVTLKRGKTRRLLKDLRIRVQRTVSALPDRSPPVAGPIVCGVINEALNPKSPLCTKSAPLLRGAVTCRTQLAQLDYEIARMIAGILSDQRGPRAFRQIPYRRIRADWHLTSLVHTRNVGRVRASRQLRRH